MSTLERGIMSTQGSVEYTRGLQECTGAYHDEFRRIS